MADDRDRRDTDRAPQLMDADLPEEDTARHSVQSLEEVAREHHLALSAAQQAVGQLAPRLMQIFDAQRRIEGKLDNLGGAFAGLRGELEDLRGELHAHIAGRGRAGNGLADTEFPRGNG